MSRPTPVQRLACPVIQRELDCIAIAETGQGKTAVFLVPILDKLVKSHHYHRDVVARPEVIVIAPTRELAIQIENSAKRLAVDTGLFNSIGLVMGFYREIYQNFSPNEIPIESTVVRVWTIKPSN